MTSGAQQPFCLALIGDGRRHQGTGGSRMTPTLPEQDGPVPAGPQRFKNPVNVDLWPLGRTTTVVHEPEKSGSIATKTATKRSCSDRQVISGSALSHANDRYRSGDEGTAA